MSDRSLRGLFAIMACLFVALLTACGGGDPGSACTGLTPANVKDVCGTAGVATGNIASVLITPDSKTIAVSHTAQLSARAVDASGNSVGGAAISFNASNPAVATLADGGLTR